MELVEMMDEEYMRSFKLLNNADVNETEMKESSSSSKYVSGYCRRKTINVSPKVQFAVDCQSLSHLNQESDLAKEENLTPTMDLNVTNSGEIEELNDHINVERMLIAEGEPLLGPKKTAEELQRIESRIFSIFTVLVVCGMVVFLYIKKRTESAPTTEIPAVKGAVLMLSSPHPSSNVDNDIITITSSGESRLNFFSQICRFSESDSDTCRNPTL